MNMEQILKMTNEEGLSLAKIAEQLGSSKSTISRLLANEGYVYNKAIKQYIKESVNTGNKEKVNNVSRETINTGNSKTIKTVKCTFDLPEQLHRELKAKCALNGVKMVDYVRNVLENALKDK